MTNNEKSKANELYVKKLIKAAFDARFLKCD